jgi:hypothetical protein
MLRGGIGEMLGQVAWVRIESFSNLRALKYMIYKTFYKITCSIAVLKAG